MTKITIEFEDGTIREINATSFALTTENSETDELCPILVTDDKAHVVGVLAAAVNAMFAQLVDQLMPARAEGATREDILDEIMSLSDQMRWEWYEVDEDA